MLPALASAQIGSVELNEGLAVYGSGIYPAITKVSVCGEYRVLVAYLHGTDMLFLDRISPVLNGSTYQASEGYSFKEFNFYHASFFIENIKCTIEFDGSLKIYGEASSGHSDEHFIFTILMDLQTRTYEYADSQNLNRRQ